MHNVRIYNRKQQKQIKRARIEDSCRIDACLLIIEHSCRIDACSLDDLTRYVQHNSRPDRSQNIG